MSKIRVYELAKELRVPSKVLINVLMDEFGVEVKNHMSVIEDEDAALIKELLAGSEANSELVAEYEAELAEEVNNAAKKKKKRKKGSEDDNLEQDVEVIEIGKTITVKELAEKLNKPVNDVIKTLIFTGVMAAINQEIDFETAEKVAEKYEVAVYEKEEENTLEENNSEQTVVPAGISSKIFIYGIAIAAATGIYAGLSAVFGSGLSGFPSFEAVEIGKMDYALILLYIIAGCVLAVFYEKTHQITKKTAKKVPAVLREVLAGICLGICGMLIPAVMFSGEEQMGVLMKEYSQYLPLALIGVAFLKVLLTNICIQFGLKGGHFFPVIFAGVCMGYGVGMLICGNAESHLVFASAIVTAALLGGTMKKPLAVTMLLFLCYPVKLFVWIFVAAAAGSKCLSLFDKRKVENKNSVE